MSDFKIQQRVGVKLDYALDWRPFLGGASMLAATMTVSGNDGALSLTDEENDGNRTGFTIQGLTAGSIYEITISVEPSSNTDIDPTKTVEVYISP